MEKHFESFCVNYCVAKDDTASRLFCEAKHAALDSPWRITPTFHRYFKIFLNKVLDVQHVLCSMDISILFIPTFALVCSVVQGQFIQFVAIRTPLCRWDVFVQYDDIIQIHQLGLYHSHAGMLNCSTHSLGFLPRCQLLILYDDAIVLL